MLIIFPALAAFFAAKGIGDAEKAKSATVRSSNAAAAAGNSPDNGMPSSPSPDADSLVYDDEDEDGAMAGTVRAVSAADGRSPGLVGFDDSLTQEDSGQDNPRSDAWRRHGRGSRQSRRLDGIWDDVCESDYISPSPSVQYMFQAPGMFRQDNNPNLNRQPWARDQSFQQTDPSQLFETDPNDPSVPLVDDEDDNDD